MKSTDYYRGLAARLRAVDGPGNDLREFAASALCNAADIADHAKQAKARAERIQWIHVAAGVYVTRAGRNTFRLMEDGDSLSRSKKSTPQPASKAPLARSGVGFVRGIDVR